MASQAQAQARLFAVVTLLTSDSYLPGALTAIQSLLDVEGASPSRPFDTVCILTPATVGHESIQAAETVFDHVIGVEEITTTSWDELDLLGRRDLAASLTKLHVFRLTQYRKLIFLDADTLVLRPLAHLLHSPQPFSAAPDSGWPDAFNSGFMVLTPSEDTFQALVGMMAQRGSWDGGDQGLLNDFFPDWHRLSFTYNVTPSAYYTYAPAYRRHGGDVSVLHFIGNQKPWARGTRDSQVPDPAQSDYYGLVNKWFDVYERHFGTGLTLDVASRVVPPPASFKKPSFTTLPPHSSPFRPSIPLPAPIAVRPDALPPTQWDPSRSSPPRDGHLQVREPITEHYDNIWDDPSHRKQQVPFTAPTSYPAVPPSTHEWYKDIMKTGAPDLSLLKPVFPWEQPRDTAPLQRDRAPSLTASRSFAQATQSVQERVAFVPGLASAPVFTNAWDAIPGIGRYATSLAKTTSSSREKQAAAAAARAAARPTDSMGGRKSTLKEPERAYERRSDASSRDGDDEDEDETNSSEEERPPIRFRKNSTSSTLGSPPHSEPRSRSGSAGSSTGSHRAEGSGDSNASGTSSTATSAPTSPPKSRRRDVRTSPTSPRQTRSSPQVLDSLAPYPSTPHPPPPHAKPSHSHHPHGSPSAHSPKPSSIRIHTALPSSPALSSTSPRLAAQAIRNSTAARLASPLGGGIGDGPPVVRATRVFSPDTDTGVIKKQGLASLQRFVENMENANLEGGPRGSPPQGPPGSGGAWRF